MPVCHECRKRLLGQTPADLDARDFDRFVSHSDLPVIVDFWAPWCPPCRAMAPAFATASQLLEGRVLLAKVDTQRSPDLAVRFSISGIPTLILFDRGRETARMSGAMNAREIEAWAATNSSWVARSE